MHSQIEKESSAFEKLVIDTLPPGNGNTKTGIFNAIYSAVANNNNYRLIQIVNRIVGDRKIVAPIDLQKNSLDYIKHEELTSYGMENIVIN